MKMQNNDTKDEGLKGNEKIEEAIFALQQEPSQELLAHALTMIGRAFCCRTTEDTGSEDS